MKQKHPFRLVGLFLAVCAVAAILGGCRAVKADGWDVRTDGTYYLEEVEAPAGYNLLKDPAQITVNGANATTADLSSLTVTEKIANNTGSLLPATGGMGTTIFYVLGSILAVGAIVLLVTKKRMNASDK